MKVTCEHCTKEYDDLDHMTYCPHPWFPDVKEEPYKSILLQIADELMKESPDLEELQDLQDEFSVKRAWDKAEAEGRLGVTTPPE